MIEKNDITWHTYTAPAKLNLFLHVNQRRKDGYHDIQSLMQMIDYQDQLRLRVRQDGKIVRCQDYPDISTENDLSLRAAHLLQKTSASSLGVDIFLEKHIPTGGGMGGGSSDAATTLLALNQLWQTKLPRTELMKLGLQLGADVPFFIFGQTALAGGVGEKLQAIELTNYWFLIIFPPVHCATATIFNAPSLRRNAPILSSHFILQSLPQLQAPNFINDLQVVAVDRYPPIGSALAWLRQHDPRAVVTARMTGSGSSVFSGFTQEATVRQIQKQVPITWHSAIAHSLGQHPHYDLGSL